VVRVTSNATGTVPRGLGCRAIGMVDP